jgi:DNA-binding Lrp family transcriptional regulator
MRLGPDTVGRWMARGRVEKSGVYVEFRRAVEEAQAKTVVRLLRRAQERVNSKAKGGVDADPLPLLAVVNRRFSPQVRVQVASELSGIFERLSQEFEREPEIFERCLRAIGEEDGPGAVAAAPRGPARADAGGGEAVRAGDAESSAADLPFARS